MNLYDLDNTKLFTQLDVYLILDCLPSENNLGEKFEGSLKDFHYSKYMNDDILRKITVNDIRYLREKENAKECLLVKGSYINGKK